MRSTSGSPLVAMSILTLCSDPVGLSGDQVGYVAGLGSLSLQDVGIGEAYPTYAITPPLCTWVGPPSPSKSGLADHQSV